MALTKAKLVSDGVITVDNLHTNHGITTDHIGEGSVLYYTDARVMTSLGSISTSIIPDTDIAYDLGSATNRFRDLYLSGNTIYLGGDTKISVNNDGEVEFKDAANEPKRLKVKELDFVDDQGRNKRFKIDAVSGRLATFDAVGSLTADKLDLSAMSTSDLQEGTNLYYTDARVQSFLITNNYVTTTDVASLETLTSLSLAANILSYVDEAGNTTNLDLSLYLDDTNLARLVSGSLDGQTGIATFTRDDASTFTIDFSSLTSSETASDILTKIKTVDGSGSGLDADLLDGKQASSFVDLTRFINRKYSLPSGGGNVSFSNGTLSGTSRLIWLPVGDNGGEHINLEGTSGASNGWSITGISDWNIVYIRAEDSWFTNDGRTSVQPAGVSKTAYTSYVPHENDLIIGVMNGDDDTFFTSWGEIIPNGASRNRTNYIELHNTGSTNNGRFLSHSSWGTLHQTDNGYIQLGPANSSYAHIYTDRSSFYLNATINSTGDIVAYASDKRLKDNIKNIESPIEKVKLLNGITYNWNKVAENIDSIAFDSKKENVGVFAQDVQKVLPQAVKTAPFDLGEDNKSNSGENYLTVQYEKLVPLLIEAIKEQQQQIEELKSLINK